MKKEEAKFVELKNKFPHLDKFAEKKDMHKILIEKYDGKVPKSFEALESLPAVGHITASVVMSQAFGVAAFPVDTHIHRLMFRWGLSKGKSVKKTEEDAGKQFSKTIIRFLQRFKRFI